MASGNLYDMFKNYDWNSLFGTTWNLQQNQMSALSQLASQWSMWQKPNIIDNISSALLEFDNTARQTLPKINYEPSQIEKALRSTFIGFDNLKVSMPDVSTFNNGLQSLAAAVQPRYSFLDGISNTLHQYYKLSDSLVSFWQNNNLDDIPEDDVDSIDEADIKEASQVVADIISEPQNWQQKLKSKYKDVKDKYPVYVLIIKGLLSFIAFICGLIIQQYFTLNTTKQTELREEPTSKAPIIITIEPQQQVYYIDKSTRYYFLVEYSDPLTGDTHTGWIKKDTVQIPTAVENEELESNAVDDNQD